MKNLSYTSYENQLRILERDMEIHAILEPLDDYSRNKALDYLPQPSQQKVYQRRAGNLNSRSYVSNESRFMRENAKTKNVDLESSLVAGRSGADAYREVVGNGLEAPLSVDDLPIANQKWFKVCETKGCEALRQLFTNSPSGSTANKCGLGIRKEVCQFIICLPRKMLQIIKSCVDE
ncbi:hypothetical protein O9G_001390 [Rozella allomycis CSF55]|uniref:Uncharacterized protein n=1 Tax=Rozella allomycis (strain CSF55) TaxID=988480 RepID=A0A075B304_ROZAC|nr:hypothetical protein O9G_001390 [Rozella allomycis CSF55]|eukprot:EPZ36945.1 hypothetical protein O9G_001390 [Rozella allomycis CSF55]